MIQIENATSSGVPANSKAMVWIGRLLSALVVVMMGIMPIVMITTNRPMMADGMKQYGYPDNVLVPIIVAEVVSALMYAIPQTAVLGAILLTGYLGGAVATHVHAGEANWFVAVIVGIVVWLALLLRDARMRQLLPFRQ